MTVKDLFISLDMKTDKLQAGIGKAEGIIKSGVSSMMVAMAPLLGGFALDAMVGSFLDGATAVKKYADTLDLSMQEMQAWQGAAVAMGAEAQSMNDALIDMSEYIVDAAKNAGGPGVEVFKQLGIEIYNAEGKLRSASEVMLDFVEAGDKVGKQEILAQATILGLDQELIALFQMGGKELENLLARQKELAAFGEKDAEIAKKQKLAYQELNQAYQATNAMLMRVLVPALTVVTKWLSNAVIWIRQNEQFVTAFFTILATVISGKLTPALWAAAKATLAATWPFILIGGIISGVALVIDDFITYLNGGESKLKDYWKVFGSGKEILEWSSDAWLRLKEIFALVIQQVVNVKDLFLALGTGVGTPIERVSEVLSRMLQVLKDIVIAFADIFGFDLAALGQKIKDSLLSALESVTNKFKEVIDFFKFWEDDDDKKPPSSSSKPKNPKPPNSPSPYPYGGGTPETPYSSPSSAAIYSASNPQVQGRISNQIQQTSSIGTVNIHTNETTGRGVANEIPKLMRSHSAFDDTQYAANTGVQTK